VRSETLSLYADGLHAETAELRRRIARAQLTAELRRELGRQLDCLTHDLADLLERLPPWPGGRRRRKDSPGRRSAKGATR
jgi:hypothetical protein